MFRGKELIQIILAIIVLIFAINFTFIINQKQASEIIIINTVSIAIIVFLTLFVKKLTAYYYETDIETRIWMWQRYGFKRWMYFKKPIPVGIIMPFIASILSYGYFLWLAALEFEVHAKSERASKRHGIYRYSEMTEIHIGLIAASGVAASLILAVIAYLTNFPETARLAVYYAAYSLVPLGNLDGTKIFFGSRVLWYTLAAICLIFLGYSLMLV